MADQLTMRYGCNPHQAPARCFRRDGGPLPLRVLNGSPSYINLLDALNSWQLVRQLRQALSLPAAASFKHVSPAGAAVGVPLDNQLRAAYFVEDEDLSPLATAYLRARGADPLASFGDWVALSDTVDAPTAHILRREVSDGVIAPGYEPAALEILKGKKGGDYRVLKADPEYEPGPQELREVFGLALEQPCNLFVPDENFFAKVVTQKRDLPQSARRDLVVATLAIKYTQSNSVALALKGQVIGIGAGQQSRVHCVRLAAAKADLWRLRQHPRMLELKFRKGIKRAERINAIDLYLQEDATPQELKAWEANFAQVPARLTTQEKREWLDGLKGVALSSDAFFPFRDNLDRAQRSGVEYVVQTGGSISDDLVIAAADEYGMVMVNSGVRLFNH
ncbi:MAG: phosphoribosylaminoimidazolecarboxamide formyltransferase [Candidatus Handelsmanbacteria bacterium]|nr:phosphoribosylaminoimidazolecarboxamide formyltransferase [Candidatus Handelsmanbacteria bacterium]